LRGGKGGSFMVGPGRPLASLRHWWYMKSISYIKKSPIDSLVCGG